MITNRDQYMSGPYDFDQIATIFIIKLVTCVLVKMTPEEFIPENSESKHGKSG
jgi:hypothetical protein